MCVHCRRTSTYDKGKERTAKHGHVDDFETRLSAKYVGVRVQCFPKREVAELKIKMTFTQFSRR